MNKRIPLGALELEFISLGSLWLDGGAMFGVVPKTLWSQVFQVDEANRIPLSCHSLLIHHPDGKILVETGVGNRWNAKFQEIYRIAPADLSKAFQAVKISVEDVTHVVNTHLHFDHAGGNCIERYDQVIPTFPQARYCIQKKEWDHALNPTKKDRASYRLDDFLPLASFGRLMLLEGDQEVLPGVWVWQVGAHSPGMQVVYVESQGEKALFWGDLIPTTRHIPLPWIMSYDCYPLETLAWKEKLLAKSVKEGWLALFYHDPDYIAGRVKEKSAGKYTFTPI